METHGPRDSLQRELVRERLKNPRRSNTVRFWGVSAFFLLFLVLGGLLRMPAWSGNLWLFALYWLATTAIFLVSRRSERIVLASGMAVALFDAGSAWRALAEGAKEFDVITMDLCLSSLSGRAFFERLERDLARARSGLDVGVSARLAEPSEERAAREICLCEARGMRRHGWMDTGDAIVRLAWKLFWSWRAR